MANGNETWIDPATLRNIERVYEYLAEQTSSARAKKKRTPRYSYQQLSKLLRMNPKQVAFACRQLAYKREPYVRIHAISFGSQTGVKTTEHVELVRSL